MAVKIRLSRTGRKKMPYYRVVVADERMPRDGRFIEILGHYDPKVEPSLIVIDKEKASAWLAKGAQPSGAVVHLLEIVGVLEKPVKKVPKKKKKAPTKTKEAPAKAKKEKKEKKDEGATSSTSSSDSGQS